MVTTNPTEDLLLLGRPEGNVDPHFGSVIALKAIRPPTDPRPPGLHLIAQGQHVRALVLMLQGWLAYADAYAAQFGLPIGTSTRQQEWVAAGLALRSLLNSGGETGRLDVARLNAVIARAMQMNSIDSEANRL